jgi:hypothetical protein
MRTLRHRVLYGIPVLLRKIGQPKISNWTRVLCPAPLKRYASGVKSEHNMQGKRQNSEGTQPTSVLLGRIIKDWTTENIQLDAGVVPGTLEKICEWREK